METFLRINWKPSLEDIIDNVFINEERMERESVMYRIMQGTFQDPFKNIDEDYKAIDSSTINNIEEQLFQGSKDIKAEGAGNQLEASQESTTFKTYVPGIKKLQFKFPRMSNLNKEQQAMCLRILLLFSGSEKPQLTPKDRVELTHYTDLTDLINEEQNEFLKFAKSKWNVRCLSGKPIICEDYINLRWKHRIQNIIELPRYYVEETNIPFIADKHIVIQFVTTCLQLGQLQKIVMPTLTKPCMLHRDSAKLRKIFPVFDSNDSGQMYESTLPVSQDTCCENVAVSNNVDLVISSSGLNCLVNNVAPNYATSWVLPVLVKEYNGKNIIYIDKPVPPTTCTIPQKNMWIHKYIMRGSLIHGKHLKREKSRDNNPIAYEEESIFGNLHSDEFLKLEDQSDCVGKEDDNIYEPPILQEPDNASVHLDHTFLDNNLQENNRRLVTTDNDYLQPVLDINVVNDPDNSPADDRTSTNEKYSSNVTPADIDHDIRKRPQPAQKNHQSGEKLCNKTAAGHFVSYNLFTVGPQSVDQNELMKSNVPKQFTMLVRAKTDGIERLQDGTMQLLMMAPKLEYQVALGAEAITLEEALKQWMSLIVRPNTSLARVRISAESSEVLQIERRTSTSINNEIKRIYQVKVDESLTLLHNVIQTLTNLRPGRYVICHTIQNGAFATVYKQTNNPGKNTFDLHTLCNNNLFITLPSTPWPPLDTVVVTPMLKCFNRMPAMFYPPNETKHFKKRKPMKKNNGGTRKSPRTKKATSRTDM